MIFDLDGTVWDSEPGILACMAHAMGELGLAVPDESVLRRHIGPPLRSMLADIGVPETSLDDGVRLYRERYLTIGVFEASLYEGVETLLDRVAADGHTLSTATSKGEVPTMTMLEHFGIVDRFEVIGAATMDGSATTKVEVLARTLERLDGPPPGTCVLIGDRDLDVAGAASHGLDCIGAAWGYGGAEELRSAGAWAIAASPADVPGLLARR